MGAKHSKVAPSDLKSLVHGTNLTPEELQEFFKEYQKEYRLNKEALVKLYKRTYPDGDPNAIANEMLQTYDADKDGSIDFREFLVTLGTVQRASEEDKLKLAFQMFDIDRNGHITKQEMCKILSAIYKTQAFGKYDDNLTDTIRSLLMFQRLDKNKDDKITYNEFVEAAKEDPSIMQLLQATLA